MIEAPKEEIQTDVSSKNGQQLSCHPLEMSLDHHFKAVTNRDYQGGKSGFSTI